MRSILALTRASFLTAASYRVAMVLSLVGLLASVVPIYFVSGALQPVVASSIATEGGHYFGFLIVGLAAVYVMSAAVAAIPGTLAGTIGSGTLEALLVTRAPLPTVLAGLAGYPLLLSLIRALLLLVGGAIAGVAIAWGAIPATLVVVALLVIAYAAIGLIAAALILGFRTAGPLSTAVIALSSLLGGVYYSTRVIPTWLQGLSDLVPLTYALRAMRQLLLAGGRLTDVAGDVGMLALFAVTLTAIGTLAFSAALRHARRAGTLSQY